MVVEGQPDRFDKFTERARRVLFFAQGEADRLQSPLIEPSHIIFGLAKEADGLAAKVLANLGVKLDNLQLILGGVVESELPSVDFPTTFTINLDKISFSPRGERAVELAISEARRLNHHYYGTEHLLLGVLAEGEGEHKSETATILENNFGVDLGKVRMEIIRILSNTRTPQSVTPFFARRSILSPEALNVSNVLAGWNIFLNDPSMTEEVRQKYVEMLTSLFEKTAKEYKDQQNNPQSSN